MYIQTIGLSVIKRRIFPYEKISELVLFVCAGVGCWNVNRESKGMRLRNEAYFECSVCEHCPNVFTYVFISHYKIGLTVSTL